MRTRKIALLVCISVVAGLWAGEASLASAAEPELHASVMVRAVGKSGSVTRARVSAKQARAELPLPAQLNGGSIPRELLRAELAKGIGRFFQQVRPEPVVSRGRFVGWRIASLFANRPDIRVQELKTGDIVLRINGESVERPEDFKAVWDSLADAKEIVLEIERAGEPTSVVYTIQ